MPSFKLSFTFISLAVLFAVCGIAAIANAQETNANDNTPAELPTPALQRQVEAREQANQTQTSVRERLQERGAALQERAQQRITNLAANMSNRMESAISRMENVILRLESRMDKLEAGSVDTSEARQSLDNAQLELARAQGLIADIDTRVAMTVQSENPRETWLDLRNQFIATGEAIRTAHEALRNTIAHLKEAILAEATSAEEASSEDNVTSE